MTQGSRVSRYRLQKGFNHEEHEGTRRTDAEAAVVAPKSPGHWFRIGVWHLALYSALFVEAL
jgi:hypothetical protein